MKNEGNNFEDTSSIFDDDDLSVEFPGEQPIPTEADDHYETDLYGLGDKQITDDVNIPDIVLDILKNNGIADPNKISIADEQGNITEVSFNELSHEDKLGILQSTIEREASPASDVDLDDTEIEAINFLRENNKTLAQVVDEARQAAIDEYMQTQGETFNVDSFSDEELFTADLKTRYKTLTDEELGLELEKEKQNPELFQKKIDQIRQEYKESEIEDRKQQELASQAKQQQEYQTFMDTMITTARDTQDINEFNLEDTDKNEILDFLLERDDQGQSEFAKVLNDPNKLFELVWYAVKGKEAFDAVHEYYRKEIDTIKKTAPRSTQTIAIRPASSGKEITSIEELI